MFASAALVMVSLLTALLILANLSRARTVLGRNQVLNLAWEAIENAAVRGPADVFCARASGLALRCWTWLLVLFACVIGFLLSAVAPDGLSVGFGIVMLVVAVAFAAAVPELERQSEDCKRSFERLTGLDVSKVAARVRTGARKEAA